MRITFVLPHIKIAGGVRISLTYADLLARKGHTVNVVIKNKVFIRRILANMLNSKPYWYKGNKARFLRVPELTNEHIPNADVIIGTAWQATEFFNSYEISKGKQFSFIQHDERLYHGDPEKVTAVYKYATIKIVISTWLQDIMKKDFNVDTELFLTPVDQNLFHFVDGKREKNFIRILILNHNYDWKGVKEGIAAYRSVKEHHPEIKLVMFGVRDIPVPIECDEYHHDVKQAELAELYSSCDIYLCPSWYEGLGMPPMEAMACRSALVTFDTGGSRDYAINNETAFVAKHKDVADLADKLMDAVDNRDKRERIAKQGFEFITNSIESWDTSTDRLEKTLQKYI